MSYTNINPTPLKCTDVAILMATYNGESYLAQQLDSILAQTHTQWHLYIQDDHSTDLTPQILHSYVQRNPRITLLQNPGKSGAKNNFLNLLQRIEAPLYAFADQDDLWLPNKLETCLSALSQATKGEQQERPIIVCTDLQVVDHQLRTIHTSFWQMQRIAPQLLQNFYAMAAHCLCTGCTMLFNHAARQTALPPAPEALMHDVWLTLTTTRAGGKIIALPQATILYRQHGHNTIGAEDLQHHHFLRRLSNLITTLRNNIAHYRQMRALGFPSPWVYIKEKINYHHRYNQLLKQ